MSSADFFIKLRDAAQIIADACQKYLEELAPTDGKASWNPDRMKWQQTQGSSGFYEKCEDINSLDFKALLKDLAANQGKLSRDGYFYWVFQNGATVGRKKRK